MIGMLLGRAPTPGRVVWSFSTGTHIAASARTESTTAAFG